MPELDNGDIHDRRCKQSLTQGKQLKFLHLE